MPVAGSYSCRPLVLLSVAWPTKTVGFPLADCFPFSRRSLLVFEIYEMFCTESSELGHIVWHSVRCLVMCCLNVLVVSGVQRILPSNDRSKPELATKPTARLCHDGEAAKHDGVDRVLRDSILPFLIRYLEIILGSDGFDEVTDLLALVLTSVDLADLAKKILGSKVGNVAVGWTLQSPRRKVHGFGRRPASGEEGSLGSSPRERAGVQGD